jgi:hypothetical protein
VRWSSRQASRTRSSNALFAAQRTRAQWVGELNRRLWRRTAIAVARACQTSIAVTHDRRVESRVTDQERVPPRRHTHDAIRHAAVTR